jgi:hypothetical protein
MTTQEETAELLRLFLIQRKKLSIPTLGAFEWVRIPATYQVETGTFSGPSERFRFSDAPSDYSQGLLSFISA